MADLRENVETVLNHARVLKAVIAMAEEIDSIQKLVQLRSEAEMRLQAAAERESALSTLDADLAAGRTELADLTDKIAKAREVWSGIIGPTQ